jgi:hypothetical protein
LFVNVCVCVWVFCVGFHDRVGEKETRWGLPHSKFSRHVERQSMCVVHVCERVIAGVERVSEWKGEDGFLKDSGRRWWWWWTWRNRHQMCMSKEKERKKKEGMRKKKKHTHKWVSWLTRWWWFSFWW